MKYIDLHTHSNKSDGTFTPAQLVQYALEKKLSAIAITDHDSVLGIDEALQEAKGKDIEVIPGMECSSSYQGKDIHILGLLLDYKDEIFQKQQLEFIKDRNMRNEKVIELLQQQNISISIEELKDTFGEATLTRAHIARYLVAHNHAKDIPDAFTKFLGDDAPCYVPRKKIPPEQVIQTIVQAKGIPILAHPLRYHFSVQDLDSMVKDLKSMGLMGLEAIYTANHGMDESNMKRLARKYDLAISGGSDFHGDTKPQIDLGVGLGNLRVPYDLLSHLKEIKNS